jgi:hypothetical protein
MTDDTITITKGRRERQGDEKDFNGPDDTYPVILSSVSDPYEADSQYGKDGKGLFRDLTFAFENPENEGQVLDKRINAKSTSEKSAQFEVASALLGRTLAVGETFKWSDLIGRSCLASVKTNDKDYPFFASFMALPKTTPRARVERAQEVSASIESRQAVPAAPEQPKEAASLPF